MKKRLLHSLGLLTVIGLIGPAAALRAGGTEPSAPVEHHIYLHIVPPRDGEPVQVFVAPHKEKEIEKERKPVAEPEPILVEETEIGALIEKLVPAEEPVEAAAEEPVEEKIEEEEALEEALIPPVLKDEDAAELTRDVPMGLLFFIFVLAIFLGVELISKVPSQLHTPLMSGSNAISGITIVGALAAAGLGVGGAFGTFLGVLAVIFATINVVGGYMVTNRMLGMFKKKDGGAR